jgi:hypothetical protein
MTRPLPSSGVLGSADLLKLLLAELPLMEMLRSAVRVSRLWFATSKAVLVGRPERLLLLLGFTESNRYFG